MRKILFSLLLLISTTSAIQAQTDSQMVISIKNQIMWHGKCYDELRDLCKNIGHRLSGSEQAAQAVNWAYDKLQSLDLDSVWLQHVIVPKWMHGKEEVWIDFGNGKWQKVPALSLGNTKGTDGKLLEKEIVVFESLEEFDQASDMAIKDKIVLFNYRFKQELVNTFDGYSDAGKYRWQAVSRAAQKGAAAVMIRSVGTNLEDIPHTGATSYAGGPEVPAIALGAVTSKKLFEHKSKKIRARIKSSCKMLDSVMSYNVIGQINGTIPSNKYILVGGHLDSWDVGEGAHDDGGGCVQSIEVLRTFKTLQIKPRHNIRAVLFMNEENGLMGGKAYSDSAISHKENHLFAVESDAGVFAPTGIGFRMNDSLLKIAKSWYPLFHILGIYNMEFEFGGADISPLQKNGVPVGALVPDAQRYFELHHTNLDVFEAVNHRELKLGAAALSTLVYLTDKYFD